MRRDITIFKVNRNVHAILLKFSSALMFVALFLSGCSTAPKTTTVVHPIRIPSRKFSLPEPPPRHDPLKIDVVYPEQGAKRPNVDSNFIFGSVGTGAAELTINGVSVPVAKNGAFLGYLAMPKNDSFVVIAHEISMQTEGRFDTSKIALQHSPSIPSEHVSTQRKRAIPIEHNLDAIIVKGSDTLQTGSDCIPASPEPGTDRVWLFPKGTRINLGARSGDEYGAVLSPGVMAWVPDTSIETHSYLEHSVETINQVHVQPDSAFVDIRIAEHFAPFLIEADERTVDIIVYGKTTAATPRLQSFDPLIKDIEFKDSLGSAHIIVHLNSDLWGYKAFFFPSGTLSVRIRRPPHLDNTEPLRGLRILLDPGHPPGGAIGPTRLKEEDANLAIALRVRDKLIAKGAHVFMTRTTGQPIVSFTNQFEELGARVDSAVRSNADLLLSIHNNAFPDGKNPFENNGTATYYFYPFAAPLAESLEREISAVTGVPALGARTRSLALVRPTWMPCVLTESLYMMFPEQEAALRDPVFLDRLAEAHLKGIEDFLRGRMERP